MSIKNKLKPQTKLILVEEVWVPGQLIGHGPAKGW
jgi:hypothetical protein